MLIAMSRQRRIPPEYVATFRVAVSVMLLGITDYWSRKSAHDRARVRPRAGG
ncbi:hypothetical protein DFJ64_2630 [Thermasporomyces composti]|uniref:Uncharacterized protein n=1 Tax=Thermasporomyces composti TaxID=696763 RepID=A0A3D9VAK5_THECX|nr:hypothetical protein DFJ64_2630 [Thermasporomyces composti]